MNHAGAIQRKRGPRLLGAAALLAAAVAAYHWWPESAPQTVHIDPATLPAIGKVSERFLSYNVEMVEVTGGRFWRPYSDGEFEGDDRYEYRPPLDLSHPRLVRLAAALGPAYVRFSGTWANATYFDPDAASDTAPPAGFDTVLTGEQWRNAIAFVEAVDGQIVTSFATSPGVRDPDGVWHTERAELFLHFTQDAGTQIAAAEFANEPNMIELTQPPEGYTPEDYRRDYGTFYEWLRRESPDTIVLAPGAVELGEPTETLSRWASGLELFDRDDLIVAGEYRPGAVSFHFYGAGAQRCGEIPLIGYGKDDALSDSWIDLIEPAIRDTAALRDRIAPEAPIWLTETGEAACGGNPWAAHFTDSFRFVDQLARSARDGVEVYFHNTLAASDYALLDEESFAPRPNYWAALLWRQLMGTRVLSAGQGTTGLNVYAHCLRGERGGVAMVAINLDEDETRVLESASSGSSYALRQGMTPDIAILNGRELGLGAGDSLPELNGVDFDAGEIVLAPASITFLAFPDTANPACAAG